MDYESFKKEINIISGINLGAYKEKQMKRRIDSLMRKNGYELYDLYFKALKTEKPLYEEFINYLTINVSEFFRNPEQWRVLEEEIVPVLLKSSRTLKIWSSACSTGDEPYTTAMVLSKFMPLRSIRIIATDIDLQAMEKAKAGIYSAKSVENLPKEFLDRFFSGNGHTYSINNDIKQCVEYRQLNLLKDEYPAGCDLIICRNVLIYFTEDAKDGVYTKMNKSLKPGGILFVGSTEQIILANKYNLKAIKTFFYIKEDAT